MKSFRYGQPVFEFNNNVTFEARVNDVIFGISALLFNAVSFLKNCE